jgi:isoquinoline 1-oxidoreductase alpha subunit
MRAADLLAKKDNPTHEEIVNHMSTNLCRCAAYPAIAEAVKIAAKEA